jgi:hypothetical protein
MIGAALELEKAKTNAGVLHCVQDDGKKMDDH